MKNDKKSGVSRAWLCRGGTPLSLRDRLLEAGYPKFLFRLAASRRAWAGASHEFHAPRRHD